MAVEPIKFYRGVKPETLPSDTTGIYFFENTGEIYVNGVIYGISAADKAYFEGEIAALEAADVNFATVIENITKRLTTAEGQVAANSSNITDLQTSVKTLQDDLAALDEYVGEIPEGAEATSVIDYVNERIADALKDAESETAATVAAALEQHAAENVVSFNQVNARIDGVKATAESALDKITAFQTDAAIGDEAIDTLLEIQQYIEGDAEAAAELLGKVSANEEAIKVLQEAGYLTEADLSDINETIAAQAGDITQLQTDVAAAQTQANKGVADAANALVAAQTAQATAEAAQTAADGKVAQEDFEELDGRVDNINKAVSNLQTASHSHENKDILDDIQQIDIDNWNAAETKAKEYADSLLVWNPLA